MTTTERNSNLMGIAVKNTMLTYESTWSGSLPTGEANDDHTAHLDEIVHWQIMQDQALSIPGIVENRDQVRGKITTILIHFIGSISAWAFKNGRHDIVAQVNYSDAKLKRQNLAAFDIAARIVYNFASDNAVALEPFGISALEIADLHSKMITFNSLIASVKSKKADIKSATSKLKLAVRSMLYNLKSNLDRNVKQFIDSPFYAAYFEVRKTYNLNANSTTLRGTITGQDGKRIRNAEISITNLDSLRSTNSNKAGNFRIRNLDIETCSLRILAED